MHIPSIVVQMEGQSLGMDIGLWILDSLKQFSRLREYIGDATHSMT